MLNIGQTFTLALVASEVEDQASSNRWVAELIRQIVTESHDKASLLEKEEIMVFCASDDDAEDRPNVPVYEGYFDIIVVVKWEGGRGVGQVSLPAPLLKKEYRQLLRELTGEGWEPRGEEGNRPLPEDGRFNVDFPRENEGFDQEQEDSHALNGNGSPRRNGGARSLSPNEVLRGTTTSPLIRSLLRRGQDEPDSSFESRIEEAAGLPQGVVVLSDDPVVVKSRYMYLPGCHWYPDYTTEVVRVVGDHHEEEVEGSRYKRPGDRAGLTLKGRDTLLTGGLILFLYQEKTSGSTNSTVRLSRVVVRLGQTEDEVLRLIAELKQTAPRGI